MTMTVAPAATDPAANFPLLVTELNNVSWAGRPVGEPPRWGVGGGTAYDSVSARAVQVPGAGADVPSKTVSVWVSRDTAGNIDFSETEITHEVALWRVDFSNGQCVGYQDLRGLYLDRVS